MRSQSLRETRYRCACAQQQRARPVSSNYQSRPCHTRIHVGSRTNLCRDAAGVTNTGLATPNAASEPSSSSSSSSTAAVGDAATLVNSVLEQVAGTDGGVTMTAAQRAEVDALLDQLEAIGSTQQPRPLDNPLLFGNYDVVYTSTAKAPTERGQPAGGRFRGRIGRALFRTTGVFQSVLQPDIATNKVAFRLFGVLPGAIGLRGKVLPVAAGEPHGAGKAGEKDTVKVLFEPPVLSFADKLHLRLGSPSSVQLSTPYLDKRVRLGKGSRGSLFVFARGGAADQAGMDQVGIQKSTFAGLAGLTAAFLAMIAGGCALWTSGMVALKVAACVLWLVSILLGSVMRQGGLIRDDDDIKRVQELMQRRQDQRKEQEQQAAAIAVAGTA